MASIKQRKSKFSVIYWYMDDTGERKQKWDTLETKKEAKARKAFIELYQQTYGYVLSIYMAYRSGLPTLTAVN